MTTSPLALLPLCLLIVGYDSASRESPLYCWRCEVTKQVSDKAGVFLDDCQAQFDFTQHTREECDGKCWKSVDLIEARAFNTSAFNGFLQRHAELFQRRSSRRCFSATELLRAAEMGANTSDGCRQVRRDESKVKEVCFCSDQDMCNGIAKLTVSSVWTFALVFLLYSTKRM